MWRRWMAFSTLATVAAFSMTVNVLSGSWVAGTVMAVIVLAGAVVLSPLIFPRSRPWAEAQKRAAEAHHPMIYWRPGCQFCVRMRLMLGLKGNRATWVDIWADDEAAARVREINHGDETVPTVEYGSQTRTNPPPGWVAELISSGGAAHR